MKGVMVEEQISEVGIDAAGSLFVRPSTLSHRENFRQVFRTMTGVSWDEANGQLRSPVPRAWTYHDWFRQIINDVDYECRIHLRLNGTTKWSNVPPEVRAAIEEFEADDIAALIAERERFDPEAAYLERLRESRQWERERALTEGAGLWAQGCYAEYVALVGPFRAELTPAQRMKLEIAERRACLI